MITLLLWTPSPRVAVPFHSPAMSKGAFTIIVNSLRKENLEKIHADLAFVMGCFREVLEELGDEALARHLPWSSEEQPSPFF
jgi:hypothetical protein